VQNLFSLGKYGGLSPPSVDCGWHRCMVDRRQGLSGGSSELGLAAAPSHRRTTHRSLDNGEEVVHRWWSFGSGWRRRGCDEDLEEESWRCENLHWGRAASYRAEARYGRAGVPSWPALKEVFNATSYWRVEEGGGTI
jgi:hypothetical protein